MGEMRQEAEMGLKVQKGHPGKSSEEGKFGGRCEISAPRKSFLTPILSPCSSAAAFWVQKL